LLLIHAPKSNTIGSSILEQKEIEPSGGGTMGPAAKAGGPEAAGGEDETGVTVGATDGAAAAGVAVGTAVAGVVTGEVTGAVGVGVDVDVGNDVGDA
jgi:hypothetical protein